jgi:hypothetical protein
MTKLTAACRSTFLLFADDAHSLNMRLRLQFQLFSSETWVVDGSSPFKAFEVSVDIHSAALFSLPRGAAYRSRFPALPSRR